MSTSTRSYRNAEDHLTEKPFAKFKCTKCKQTYYRMTVDKKVNTCPPCMNGKEPNETGL